MSWIRGCICRKVLFVGEGQADVGTDHVRFTLSAFETHKSAEKKARSPVKYLAKDRKNTDNRNHGSQKAAEQDVDWRLLEGRMYALDRFSRMVCRIGLLNYRLQLWDHGPTRWTTCLCLVRCVVSDLSNALGYANVLQPVRWTFASWQPQNLVLTEGWPHDTMDND